MLHQQIGESVWGSLLTGYDGGVVMGGQSVSVALRRQMIESGMLQMRCSGEWETSPRLPAPRTRCASLLEMPHSQHRSSSLTTLTSVYGVVVVYYVVAFGLNPEPQPVRRGMKHSRQPTRTALCALSSSLNKRQAVQLNHR